VRRSYVRSEGRLVAVLGLADVVLVATDDVVFAAPLDRAQDVRALVERLQQAGRAEATSPSKVYRPWGYYQSVDAGDRFLVKRIVVVPGGRLSLQMHHHRAEHWIVVRGTAEVTRGKDRIMLSENESIYVPIGETHRLVNPGKIPLHLIEVQTGSYLAEDDIVRFDDSYGRA
jgi:mannose-1-phosphate guanylyltransferase / mannose-6-phosphate isomerase